jgi:hypothetical protein
MTSLPVRTTADAHDVHTTYNPGLVNERDLVRKADAGSFTPPIATRPLRCGAAV